MGSRDDEFTRAFGPDPEAPATRARPALAAVAGRPVPHRQAAKPDPQIPLTSLGELLEEPDEVIDCVVEGLMHKGSVSVLAAKPKVGKSTVARHLAIAVARGDEFLGRRCPIAEAVVWYLAFEGNRPDIRKAFRKLGGRRDDAVRLFIGRAPDQVIAKVRARAALEKPTLIIIDTMQRFLRAKSTDDYAEMTLLFDHVIGIAQQSHAALLLLTHNSKIAREGLDSILGSTAIAGSVDTAILLTRTARYRTIATVQRTGDDLGETLLGFDPETGRVHLAGSRHLADQEFLRSELLDVLVKAEAPLRKAEWLEGVEARKTLKLAALKDLVSGSCGNLGNHQVEVTGSGTKARPYLYAAKSTDSGSVVPLGGGNHHFSTTVQSDLLNESLGNGGSRIHTGREPEKNALESPEPPEPESEPEG